MSVVFNKNPERDDQQIAASIAQQILRPECLTDLDTQSPLLIDVARWYVKNRPGDWKSKKNSDGTKQYALELFNPAFLVIKADFEKKSAEIKILYASDGEDLAYKNSSNESYALAEDLRSGFSFFREAAHAIINGDPGSWKSHSLAGDVSVNILRVPGKDGRELRLFRREREIVSGDKKTLYMLQNAKDEEVQNYHGQESPAKLFQFARSLHTMYSGAYLLLKNFHGTGWYRKRMKGEGGEPDIWNYQHQLQDGILFVRDWQHTDSSPWELTLLSHKENMSIRSNCQGFLSLVRDLRETIAEFHSSVEGQSLLRLRDILDGVPDDEELRIEELNNVPSVCPTYVVFGAGQIFKLRMNGRGMAEVVMTADESGEYGNLVRKNCGGSDSVLLYKRVADIIRLAS